MAGLGALLLKGRMSGKATSFQMQGYASPLNGKQLEKARVLALEHTRVNPDYTA